MTPSPAPPCPGRPCLWRVPPPRRRGDIHTSDPRSLPGLQRYPFHFSDKARDDRTVCQRSVNSLRSPRRFLAVRGAAGLWRLALHGFARNTGSAFSWTFTTCCARSCCGFFRTSRCPVRQYRQRPHGETRAHTAAAQTACTAENFRRPLSGSFRPRRHPAPGRRGKEDCLPFGSSRHRICAGSRTRGSFLHGVAAKTAGEYWLAVAPFAAHKGKIYPPGLMREVIMHFAAQKVCVFFFSDSEKGGKRNRPSLRGMRRHGQHGAGAPRNRGLNWRCCRIATQCCRWTRPICTWLPLAGLRAVTVWGATHPCTGFYGAGQNPADAIQLDMACRPCSIFGNRP